MTSHAHITDELLSAYIDNEVTAQERALVEAAVEQDPDVAWRLASLRYTVDLVRQLPELAPPSTFTLTEQQAAGILNGAIAAPAPAVHSADAAPSWLDRLRDFFRAGNPVWRNAAAACAALLVVFVLGGEFFTAPGIPEMQVRDQTSDAITPLSAPAAVMDAQDAPAADAVTMATVPATSPATEADTPLSNDATTAAEVPAVYAASDDVGEGDAAVESDSSVGSDGGVASAAVTDAAPEARGNRATAQEAPLGALGMQSAPLSSPGSEDELQALMAPPAPDAGPPLTEPMAAASVADAPPVTQDVTPDVAPAALALDEAGTSVDDSSAAATENAAKAEAPEVGAADAGAAAIEEPAQAEQAAQSAPAREDDAGNHAEIGPVAADVQSVEPSAVESGTTTSTATDGSPRETPAWRDGVQLILAALALLFGLLWLLSMRRAATIPAKQINRS